jgi:hypothetical protein
MEVRTIYLATAADLFFPNSPRSSFQPNRMNRINKRMTALPNAKSTLSSTINTVTKPYADATATTHEMVSRVSSSNLSSVYEGSFLCLAARGAFVTSTSLLCFHSLCMDECTGNGGPGSLIEHRVTTGRLGLGLLGLEGEVFGSSPLLARDHVEDLFLGLG